MDNLLFLLQLIAVSLGASLAYIGMFFGLMSTTTASRLGSMVMMIVGIAIAVSGALVLLT